VALILSRISVSVTIFFEWQGNELANNLNHGLCRQILFWQAALVAGDINGDCNVNFKDFAIMAAYWLEDNRL
jgi:hypothetical protein